MNEVKAHYERNTPAPIVRGLMIAERYTDRARRLVLSLAQIGSPRLEFKTWGTVIAETRALHQGWLAVSRRRAEPDQEQTTN